jgi:hypothetical protein
MGNSSGKEEQATAQRTKGITGGAVGKKTGLPKLPTNVTKAAPDEHPLIEVRYIFC